MEFTLSTLKDEEILHFLGNAKVKPNEDMMRVIERMKEKVIALGVPRMTYKVFHWKNQQVEHIDFTLDGKDIKRLLKECHQCIFMAVTLGVGIEKEMRKLQLKDMGEALIFDCCANAAIEHICDQVQDSLEKEYAKVNLFLTDRYSCGYGDLRVTIQKDFLRVLDAQKKIGLYVNDSSILHPMKSVTAIIGIAKHVQPAILRGCAYCSLRDRCMFRKGGTTCGK